MKIFSMNSLFSGLFFVLRVLSIRYKKGKKSQVHLCVKYSKVLSKAAVGMDYRVKKQTVSDIMHKLTQGNTEIQHNKYI
jgi:hypothetical protein